MVKLYYLALVFASTVLAQDTSSTDSLFTIQTSPPTPESSGSSAPSTSLSGSGTPTSSGAFAPTATPESQLPTECNDACEVISNALSTCASDSTLNTTCLCTTEIEQSYVGCIQCAVELNPDPNSLASYQALINGYITQCATADPPVTLPNATITFPGSTSASNSANSTASASGSSSASGNSSTSRSTSASTSTVVLPSTSLSRPPVPSSSAAASAASASTSPSGGAGRVRGEVGWYGGVALASLVSVVGGMMVLA